MRNCIEIRYGLTCASLLALLLLPASCNKASQQAQQPPAQVSASRPAGAAGAQQPISMPESVARALPLEAGWKIQTFSEDKAAYYITAQSPSGAMETAGFLLKWMNENGFDNADNPSRILEGTEFTGGRGKFKRIFAKCTLDAESNCIVELTAYR